MCIRYAGVDNGAGRHAKLETGLWVAKKMPSGVALWDRGTPSSAAGNPCLDRSKLPLLDGWLLGLLLKGSRDCPSDSPSTVAIKIQKISCRRGLVGPNAEDTYISYAHTPPKQG